jgi:hypothetical protein
MPGTDTSSSGSDPIISPFDPAVDVGAATPEIRGRCTPRMLACSIGSARWCPTTCSNVQGVWFPGSAKRCRPASLARGEKRLAFGKKHAVPVVLPPSFWPQTQTQATPYCVQVETEEGGSDGPLPLTLENVEKTLDEMRPYLMADGGNVRVSLVSIGVCLSASVCLCLCVSVCGACWRYLVTQAPALCK